MLALQHFALLIWCFGYSVAWAIRTRKNVPQDIITIRSMTGKIEIPRSGLSTVGDVRRCLEARYNSKVHLFKDGNSIGDDVKIDEETADSISVLVPIRGGMSVQVLTMLGESVTVDVKEDATVLDLKKQLSKKQKLPVDQQRIIYEGKMLEDSKTLAEYNIKNNSVIHMVVRLRGGVDAPLHNEL